MWRVLKTHIQPLLSPSLGGIRKLGDTPRPSASTSGGLHLFYSSLNVLVFSFAMIAMTEIVFRRRGGQMRELHNNS